jgi:hypothetical protein
MPKKSITKSIAVIATSFMLYATSQAQTIDRDAAISRIEALHVGQLVLDADSPFLSFMLRPVASTNPGLSKDELNKIAKDFSAEVVNILTNKGGAYDTFFRTALGDLSDSELIRLEQLLNDPVYRRMQMSMGSTQGQRGMIQAMSASTSKLKPAMNSILSKHGLKPVP